MHACSPRTFLPPSVCLGCHRNRNLNYWDSAASFAGEVQNPGRTFPRAVLACVVLVVACNGLPILVGTGSAEVAAVAAAASRADDDVSGGGEDVRWSLWTDGYFAEVADAIAGRWLGVWVVLAAAAANIGLFEAEMSSDAFQVMGMVSFARGRLVHLVSSCHERAILSPISCRVDEGSFWSWLRFWVATQGSLDDNGCLL